MGYRTRLGTICNATGFTGLRWRRFRSGLFVFTYHRIGDATACHYDRGVFSCTETTFREHLALFRDRFELLNLESLYSMVSARSPLHKRGRPLALITFDDGYIDNFLVALPVLRAFGLTAVFFIATAFVGAAELPWWDQIAWSVRHATVDRFRLRGFDEVFELHPDVLDRSIMRVLMRVRTPTNVHLADRVAEIQDACQPFALPSAQDGSPFMSWDQVRELHRAGMDIGSHTHTHPVLSHLDASGQRHELAHSKALLEAELGEPVTAVAYPAAKSTGYTDETVRIARTVGYQMGFNFRNLSNSDAIADPLDIHRLDVDGDINVGALKTHICFPWL